MSDTATDTSQADPTAAEADGAGAAGGGSDGATTTDAPAAAATSTPEAPDALVRALQAEKDRARALNDKMEAHLASVEKGTASTTTEGGDNDPLIGRLSSLEGMVRGLALAPTVSKAKDDNKVLAAIRPDLFEASKYDSPEQFQAAIITASETLKPTIDSIGAAAVEAAQAQAEKDGGGLTPSPSGTGDGGTTPATVTAAAINKMSLEEIRTLSPEDRAKVHG